MSKPLHPIAFVAILWTAIFSWSKWSSSNRDSQMAESAAAEFQHVDSQSEADSPPVAVETPL